MTVTDNPFNYEGPFFGDDDAQNDAYLDSVQNAWDERVEAARTQDNPAEIQAMTRQNGVAGNFWIITRVRYSGTYCGEAWEEVSTCMFHGSVYGDIIALSTAGGAEFFVDQKVVQECGGKLTEDWVRAFFARGGELD